MVKLLRSNLSYRAIFLLRWGGLLSGVRLDLGGSDLDTCFRKGGFYPGGGLMTVPPLSHSASLSVSLSVSKRSHAVKTSQTVCVWA